MNFLRLYRDPDPDPATNPGSSSSVSTTLPLPKAKAPETPAPVTPPAAASAFTVPDGFKDKPYLKGVDSMDKVFKMLDGAQELIGKRPAGIPAADATPEEKAKFFDALGRPKTAGEYQFEGADKADPKFLPKVQEVFHKHGLSQDQAKGVYADVVAELSSLAKERGIAEQQQNVDFDDLANKSFGVNRDKVMSTSKALLEANVSPAMKDHIAKLPNESLVVLADVLNNINAKYIKQDGPPGGQPTTTSMSRTDIQAKGRELMASEAYTNPFHANHGQTVKQVQELYSLLK